MTKNRFQQITWVHEGTYGVTTRKVAQIPLGRSARRFIDEKIERHGSRVSNFKVRVFR